MRSTLNFAQSVSLAILVGFLAFYLDSSDLSATEDKISTINLGWESAAWTWSPTHDQVIALDSSNAKLTIFSTTGEELHQQTVRKKCRQVEVVGDSIVVCFRPSSTRIASSGPKAAFDQGFKEADPDGFHIFPIDDPEKVRTVKLDRSLSKSGFFLNPDKKDRIHFIRTEKRDLFLGTLLLETGKVTWEQFAGENENRKKISKVLPLIVMGPDGPVAAMTTYGSRKPLNSLEPLVLKRYPRSFSGGRGSGPTQLLAGRVPFVGPGARFISGGTNVVDNQSGEVLFDFPKSKKPEKAKSNSRNMGLSLGGGKSRPNVFRGPVAFHPKYDIVAYGAWDKLMFFSLSNRKLIRSWTLSDHVDNRPSTLDFPKTVRFDGDRVFVAYEKFAFVINFENAIEEKLETRSRLPQIQPLVLSNGSPFELDLRKFVSGESRFKLKDRPEGMRISNGIIKWTPELRQSGIFTATVVMTVGGKSDKVDLAFIVRARSCVLGFTPEAIRFDRSGERFVCWGGTPFDRRDTGFKSIAIVDVKRLKIISATGLGSAIEGASIDKSSCYVKTRGSAVLNRYDARNLGKPPIRIQETNEAAIANISKFARSGMEGARQRSGKDAWTDIGSVRSLRNDELMAILDPADMPVIPRDFQTAQHRMRKQFQKTRFDTRFDFSTSQFPWEFSMKRVKKKNARTFDAWLEVRPTLPDELAPSLSKSQVWLGNFDEESGSGEARIFYLHDRVVVFFRTEVFAVELPKYDGPPEFRLMWPDIGPLSAEKIEEVKLPIVGGDGKYRMALERSMVGLRLNTRDGTLLVDGPQFWKANLKDFQIHQNLMSPAPRGDRQHEWKRQYHKRYESTYGFRLPKGKLPALIPISIVANDGSGNRDQISFYLLMHGDPVAQPEVVRKETRDKVKEEKQKSVQLARRLDSVEQSFDASLRSLSIIESLLKQKLDRLKSETEKKGKSRKQKEAERKS